MSQIRFKSSFHKLFYSKECLIFFLSSLSNWSSKIMQKSEIYLQMMMMMIRKVSCLFVLVTITLLNIFQHGGGLCLWLSGLVFFLVMIMIYADIWIFPLCVCVVYVWNKQFCCCLHSMSGRFSYSEFSFFSYILCFWCWRNVWLFVLNVKLANVKFVFDKLCVTVVVALLCWMILLSLGSSLSNSNLKL